MQNNPRFHRKLLALLIAGAGVVQPLQAQENNNNLEEIVVTGVRAAQERAIDIKRQSREVVDSISAEDIGKLPDSTISDSLQRVTGVQIQRSAGQGSLVSIRGTQEVLTTLNGELFLTPDNILDSKADYKSIPAALISGSNVYKSMSATNLEGGIGGAVDLLTRRSLSLDEGLTTVVRAQLANGSITDENDPEINGMLGYKFNDKVGSYLGFSYADQTLSDQTANTTAGKDIASEAQFCACDYNGDGDQTDTAVWMHEGTNATEGYKQNRERERIGVTYNLNLQLNDALELNIDSFYNQMDERSYGHYMQLGEGLSAGNLDRSDGPALLGLQATGDIGSQYGKSVPAFYATGWKGLLDGGLRTGNFSSISEREALNNSVELRYDNGGAFTGKLRAVVSSAEQDGTTLTLANRAESRNILNGGRRIDPFNNVEVVNPGFISTRYPVSFESKGETVHWNFDPAFVDAMSQHSAWYINSGWVEGGQREADLTVLRADGSYKFEDNPITSMDFGVRASSREAENESYHYFSDSGIDAVAPDGTRYDMLWKFHEPTTFQRRFNDGPVGSIPKTYSAIWTDGNTYPMNFDVYKVPAMDDANLQPYITYLTDLGAAISGFNAKIPVIDTSRIKDNVDFMTFLYGQQYRYSQPQFSYRVIDDRDSIYLNTNFEFDLVGDLSLSGNLGVRHVKETIEVTRNITDSRLVEPNILATTDINWTSLVSQGKTTEQVEHDWTLPSINLILNIGDEYKLRASADKRTSLQELGTFGNGPSSSFNSQRTGESFQRINSISMGGNPNLKPWSAEVYNLAGEWYPADSTALSLTWFYMDIGGFVDSVTRLDPTIPDGDGVARDGARVSNLVNGKNATIKGLEFAYQQSFDELPGLLSHTGITFNYTYSPNVKEGKRFIATGDEVPFNNTAKNQSNLVLWYNDDRFEFRAAFNYLDKRYDGQETGRFGLNATDAEANTGLISGLDRWEAETLYVDLSSTYHISENWDASLNVQNLTEESSVKYIHWEDFRSNYAAFERRITLGLNARF